MCIAIYKPAGKTVTEEALKNSFENNKDGCGFAYINTDDRGVKTIKIKKTLEYDTFIRQYRRAIQVAPESPFLIHFRIKTHGLINKDNCHPHRVDSDHVFIHNGIIKGMKFDKTFSDTVRFNKDFMQLLPEGWMTSEGILRMIEHIVDMGKIVVMNIEGEVQICNEKAGNWKDGVWYSNKSYEPKKIYTSPYSSTYRYPHGHQNQGSSYGSLRKTNSVWSYKPCAGCNVGTAINKMKCFLDESSGTGMGYCSMCAPRIEREFPELEVYRISDECYLQSIRDAEEGNFSMNVSWFYNRLEWVNPWGEVPEDGDEDEDAEDVIDITPQEQEEALAEYYDNMEDSRQVMGY